MVVVKYTYHKPKINQLIKWGVDVSDIKTSRGKQVKHGGCLPSEGGEEVKGTSHNIPPCLSAESFKKDMEQINELRRCLA